jgi:hypothetical protein
MPTWVSVALVLLGSWRSPADGIEPSGRKSGELEEELDALGPKAPRTRGRAVHASPLASTDRYSMSRGSLPFLVALLIAATPALISAGEKRYVVDNTDRGANAWPLWTSQLARDACSRALREGTKKEREALCEAGVSGTKPMLGSLPHGTEVELLDARASCGQMVTVRVLYGPLQGEAGCIARNALSSVKPE